MKRRSGVILALFFLLLGIPTANAATNVVLTEPTHRQIDGLFIDDDLAMTLSVTGRLGSIVFNPPKNVQTLRIDPALIEEVVAMSNGYKLTDGSDGAGQIFAQAWLAQLTQATATNDVSVIVYGNPSRYWVNRLLADEAHFVLSASTKILETLLNRPAKPVVSYHNKSQFTLTRSDIEAVNTATDNFRKTSMYVDPIKRDGYKLALMKLLNPDLPSARREYLIRDLTANAYLQLHMIYLSPGKFTVTSTHQNIPITIANKFPTSAKINLYIHPANAKIRVAPVTQEVIRGNSKIQVLIPLTVLTSGSSGIRIELRTPSGDILGEPLTYPIELSVLSPVATWITTTAAIVLFLAAIIQGIRRIRRGKK